MQFVTYTMVSGIAFMADTLVLMMMVMAWGLPPGIGAAASFMVGLLLNFALCRRMVFPDTPKTGLSAQFGKFALSGLGGLVATVVLVETLVIHLGWPLLVAKFSAAGVVIVLNFYVRSTFVFKRA